MSTLNAERLYPLLPSLYRLRDAEQGEPLKALIALIAREFEALEENIEQLYDDQFIETCDDWVAPYIGDLIGYRPLHGASPAVSSPRAEVANTIAYRRRKGTAAMLEQLARDVTDWPARAVEFFEQLATTQYMKHIRLHAPATADLRATRALLDVDGAFNRAAHTAEMRDPAGGSGRWNIPNIGLFLWRLQPQSLSRLPLTPDALDASGRRFRLNPLGADAPLFRLPRTEPAEISHIAEAADVPARLSIRALAIELRAAQNTALIVTETSAYGDGRSLVLYRDGALVPINQGVLPNPVALLRSADLRDVFDAGNNFIGWAHEASVLPDEIAIDPERGRVLLGSARAAEHADSPFLASFHLGASRDIGGGEYERIPAAVESGIETTVSGSAALQPALNAIASGGRLLIGDSLRYSETPIFRIDDVTAANVPGLEVVVAAKNGARPLIAASGELLLDIGARGRLVLEGLVISGGALRIAAAAAGDNEKRELVLRHCTLLPGLNLNPDGSAVSPGAPSLIIENPFARVTLDRCISGPIHAVADAEVSINDSIIDAGASTGRAYQGLALDEPGATLSIIDSTVFGQVHAERLELASNTIFSAALAAPDSSDVPVRIERRQQGCARFSFVPAGSRVPRRHRCLPDDLHPDVLPQFSATRYGDPAYAQLLSSSGIALRTGADDGSEIGVLRPLQQPQRESNLRTRLDEYLRYGLKAGFFYVS